MMRPIERVDMNQEELDALLERAKTGPLSEEDCAKLKGVIETLSYLTDLLEDRKTTIQKLRQILFGASYREDQQPGQRRAQQQAATETGTAGRKPHSSSGPGKRARAEIRRQTQRARAQRRLVLHRGHEDQDQP